jgi:hypothetical protein
MCVSEVRFEPTILVFERAIERGAAVIGMFLDDEVKYNTKAGKSLRMRYSGYTRINGGRPSNTLISRIYCIPPPPQESTFEVFPLTLFGP